MTEQTNNGKPPIAVHGESIRLVGAAMAEKLAIIITTDESPEGTTPQEKAVRSTLLATGAQAAISLLQRGNIRALQAAALIDDALAEKIINVSELTMHAVIRSIMERLGYARNDSADNTQADDNAQTPE